MRKDHMLDAAVNPIKENRIYKFKGKICTIEQVLEKELKVKYFDGPKRNELISVLETEYLIPFSEEF